MSRKYQAISKYIKAIRKTLLSKHSLIFWYNFDIVWYVLILISNISNISNLICFDTRIKLVSKCKLRSIKGVSKIYSHLASTRISSHTPFGWGGLKKIITPTLSPLVKGYTKPLIPSLIYSASHIKDWPLMHVDASLILLDMRLIGSPTSVLEPLRVKLRLI